MPIESNKGQLSVSQFRARAGNPTPKYDPIVSSAVPSRREGWMDVTVSLAPGTNVVYRIPTSKYDPHTIRSILDTAPALYQPVGVTVDLFASE